MKQTVSLQMGGGHIANNTLEETHNPNGCAIPRNEAPYETLVFSDLQEMLLKGRTLDEHYDMVFTTIGTSYKELDKFAYGNVIKALQTIVDSKIKHQRGCTKLKEAIAFLHQDIKLSPNLIQNMVNLFDVKLYTSDILESSYKVFAERPQPKWLQNIRCD